MNPGQKFICTVGIPGYRYSAYEVARQLGVSPTTVIAWIKRGWLRASYTTTGNYKIKRKSIKRALLENTVIADTVARAWARNW